MVLGVSEGGAGVVEVTVTVVGSRPSPGVVAVVAAAVVGGALPPAVLEALHLPDEVDGEVLALTVDMLTTWRWACPCWGAGGEA